jgi:uncharacterized protein YndB with AHSA1/START domain
VAVTACPIAVVEAPEERVWNLLTTPEGYSAWLDAELLRAEPPGAVVEGQRIFFRTRALGRWWPVSFRVGAVDARRSLELTVDMPLGITNHEHITVLPLAARQTRVAFN